MEKAYLKSDRFHIHYLTETWSPEQGTIYQDESGVYRPDDLIMVDKTRLLFFDSTLHPLPILHFHGVSSENYKKVKTLILEGANLEKFPGDQLEVLSVWTDSEKCILGKQCKKWNIPITNAIEGQKIKEWKMPDKIKYYVQALEKTTSEIVLVLDGYDILIVRPEDILYEFKSLGKRIIFNATKFNYPPVEIDIVPGRENLGDHCFFNAGAAIGYRKDLLKFYKECLDHEDLFNNNWGSEQFVVRHAFAKYSKDPRQNFIGFDHSCRIFYTMGNSAVIQGSPTKYVVV